MNKIDNKQNKKNMKKIIIASILVILIVIYFIYNILQLIKKPTGTYIVENGKITQEESSTGYIIRNETVVKGENYKNGIVQIKGEGERVAKGDSVFRYYSNNEDDLIEKIKELDRKIDEALSKETDIFSNDIKLLDKKIEQELYKMSKTNNIEAIKESKKNIEVDIVKKAKIAGELSPAGSNSKKLIQQRSTYEAQLNSSSEYIKAPNSGTVSYKIDGLEKVLTTDNLANINKEFLEDLKLKVGQIIPSSSEEGKIITDFTCYIATNLKSEEAKNTSIGDKVKIRLSSNKEISATVETIQEEDDESVLIVFKINDTTESILNYRKISISVIWWSNSGFKVINSSIIEEDGLSYVIRKRNGYSDKILVKILKQNESYSIVDNYTTLELKEKLKYSTEEIKNVKSINLYDEVLNSP